MKSKVCRTGLIVWLFISWMPANSWAQEHPSAEQSKVLALESVWNLAEEKGDAGALDMIFDRAMIYIDEDGTLLTKMEFLARVKETGAHPQSLVTETIGVRIYGDMAVVAGSYRARGVKQGKPYLRDGRFIDTWVRKQGGWVCVVAQSTPVQR